MPEETLQLTLLFVDIPSAAHVRDQHGNDAATDFLAEVTAGIGRLRSRYGGHEVRSLGSMILSYFDDPAAAVRCARELRQVIGIHRIGGVHPRLRIGLHHGPVAVRGKSFYGEAVSISAKLVTLAAPEQILVTQALVEQLNSAETSRMRAVPVEKEWAASLGTLYEIPLDGEDVPTLENDFPGSPPDQAVRTNTRTLGQTESSTHRRVQLARLHRNAAGLETQHAPDSYADVARMCLIRGRTILILDRNNDTATIGRGEGNDIILDLTTASRMHAHVELRNEGFFLVDHSGNGTYTYDEEGVETLVHHGEFRLTHSGIMCPGAPGSANDVEAIRFIEAR